MVTGSLEGRWRKDGSKAWAGAGRSRKWERLGSCISSFPGEDRQGTRAGLISCPAYCPPRPSSAFLIHSEGLGLCFQHISKGSQAGSFRNFPRELVSWQFSSTKRQKLVGMDILLPNDPPLSKRAGLTDVQYAGKRRKLRYSVTLEAQATILPLGVGAPPWGPPRLPRCHQGHHETTKALGGNSRCGLFLTNAQAPDDSTTRQSLTSNSFPPGEHWPPKRMDPRLTSSSGSWVCFLHCVETGIFFRQESCD